MSARCSQKQQVSSTVTRYFHAALVAAVAFAIAGPALAQDWQAGGGQAWADLLAAARGEGALVVAGSPQLDNELLPAFTADTGLEATYLTGRGSDLRARFGREYEAGQPTIDVYIGGSSLGLAMEESGLLRPIPPMLLLPGVTDGHNWQGGSLPFADNEQQLLPVPSAYVSGNVLVNAEVMKTNPIREWADLLRPDLKGKIAAVEPRSPGPGQGAASYLLHALGPDYFKALFLGQEVRFTEDERQVVDWVARGTYMVAIGAVAVDIEHYRDQGVDTLQVVQMADEPGYLIGGSSTPVVGLNSPHPNAAAVFVNWYLSRPGQQLYSSVMRVPSFRTDVSADTAPDYVIPDPATQYKVNQSDETWYRTYRGAVTDQLRQLLGGS